MCAQATIIVEDPSEFTAEAGTCYNTLKWGGGYEALSKGGIQMRNSAVQRLALLVVLLGLTSSVFTSAQQPQPPDICSKENPTVIVDSVEKLQNAVNDPDCKKIIVQGGTYEVNLTISRNDLTIKSLAGDQKRPVITGPLPNRQTITIAGSKNVTIQGLIIAQKQGNVGIVVSEDSEDIKLKDNVLHGYPEAGISIANSQNVTLEGNRIGGNFDIDGDRTRENVVGVRIINSQGITIETNEISNNKQDGIEIISSTVTLGGNTISGNTGCGVKADPKSKVTAPSGQDKNWIFGNEGGNTCPRELSRTIRRPEILVPGHFKEIQAAIRDAEPVRGAEDTPYVIHIQQGKDEYVENLCIDRSVKIQADYVDPKDRIRIRPPNPQRPTISIGSEACPLHKDEKGNIDQEAGDQTPSVRIHISDLSIVGPSSGQAAGGFQIGTSHSDRAQRTFLKVQLKNIAIDKFKKGFMISPSAKDHKLDVQIWGTQTLQECTNKDYPRLPTLASINNNDVGIELKNPHQADFTVTVRDVEIKGHTSYGIFYEGNGNSKLIVERSRVIENQQGIEATSKEGTDPQAPDEIIVQLAHIWQNKGGVKLEATARSKLDSKLINVDIRQNAGFGVYIQGNVETTLKASSDRPISPLEPPHNCEITDNFGPGVRAHGSVVLTVENMFVQGNGYEDDRKTQPVPRQEAIKVGPDGIFASNSVQLTVRNTYVFNNAGVGIALQASDKNDTLKATFNDNRIEGNRKWGISYIVRNCLDERTMPENFYGKVEGQNNTLTGNGSRLSTKERRAGPEVGPGRDQVCPKELDSLIVRVQ